MEFIGVMDIHDQDYNTRVIYLMLSSGLICFDDDCYRHHLEMLHIYDWTRDLM